MTASSSEEFSLEHTLVLGFGVTSQAVVRSLLRRGIHPTVIDDRPSAAAQAAALEMGVELVVAPSESELEAMIALATVVLPSPGVPDHHPLFRLREQYGVALASEFDLAQRWDSRPLVAITGTNGKTTVTMMVTDALERSGLHAVAVGNTEVPLVAAIDDLAVDVFVVEASSFRLDHSLAFRPTVATWLNFSPDHLDAHATLGRYEAAKASIWAEHDASTVAIGNISDSTVVRHLPHDTKSTQTFGSPDADWCVKSGELCGPDGAIVRIDELPRIQPHDLDNAAAAAATAIAAGATVAGVAAMLRSFSGLPHRLDLIGESDGVRWYDDSKATVPHATLAAVGGFESVVLIAGGRNKGLDLGLLRQCVPPVHAVIAIGESAAQIAEIFENLAIVRIAVDMDEAIEQAADLAKPGDVVLLSPACTSFDWYKNYKERGLDFVHRATRKFQFMTGNTQ